MAEPAERGAVLSAPLVIEYPFSRTTGPVIGAFLTGLREQVLLGIKGVDGTVIVPPVEYDPHTGEDLTELVQVGPGGVVDTWAWVRHPMPKHPLQHPFAWALVRPDGAGVGFLQAVDAGSIDAMATGMRVRPRWAAEREGTIHDLECWEPEA
ncbi:MAG: Zn-ribbon domain-containing OB-fold protein [Acidimicrobiales bacterium]